jgi:hypothetical protein
MRISVNRWKRRAIAAALLAAMVGGVSGSAQADDYDGYYAPANPCPPVPCPPGTIIYPGADDAASGDANTPSDLPPSEGQNTPIPQQQVDSFQSASNSTASNLASNTSGAFDAPTMVGDFFANSLQLDSFGPPGSPTPTIAVAGGDRRYKIPENVSPIPQDRFFMTYNHFHNAGVTADGDDTSIDRIVFGLEKTFFDGLASLEFRLPFAAALNSTQQLGGDYEATEFGNIGLALKTNLLSGSDWIISGGALLTLPTGDDFISRDSFGTTQFVVDNQSVQLAPFIGFLKQHGRTWFLQGFAQTNFDLNGYEVSDGSGNEIGVIQEQNLLFLDASLGRWLYRRDNARGLLGGVAAITELHYTSTMNDSDSVVTGAGTIRNTGGRVDVLNATAALHFQRGRKALRFGGAAPLKDDRDRTFDAEFFVQYNCGF